MTDRVTLSRLTPVSNAAYLARLRPGKHSYDQQLRHVQTTGAIGVLKDFLRKGHHALGRSSVQGQSFNLSLNDEFAVEEALQVSTKAEFSGARSVGRNSVRSKVPRRTVTSCGLPTLLFFAGSKGSTGNSVQTHSIRVLPFSWYGTYSVRFKVQQVCCGCSRFLGLVQRSFCEVYRAPF